MERTMHRPIPAGNIPPNQALWLSLALILLGLSLLYFFFGTITAALGAFNILWYNLLYTILKRITPFAVVPGSLTGAVPVLMGWTAAGGYIFESTILFIGFFIYIWQIPHFWLLMLKYRSQYEHAGFPTIHQVMSPRNLKRIILSWIIATSLASIMVPLFNPNVSIAFFAAIFVLNILFVALFIQLSFHDLSEINIRKSFITINIYMFLFMIILSLYHLMLT